MVLDIINKTLIKCMIKLQKNPREIHSVLDNKSINYQIFDDFQTVIQDNPCYSICNCYYQSHLQLLSSLDSNLFTSSAPSLFLYHKFLIEILHLINSIYRMKWIIFVCKFICFHIIHAKHKHIHSYCMQVVLTNLI